MRLERPLASSKPRHIYHVAECFFLSLCAASRQNSDRTAAPIFASVGAMAEASNLLSVKDLHSNTPLLPLALMDYGVLPNVVQGPSVAARHPLHRRTQCCQYQNFLVNVQ